MAKLRNTYSTDAMLNAGPAGTMPPQQASSAPYGGTAGPSPATRRTPYEQGGITGGNAPAPVANSVDPTTQDPTPAPTPPPPMPNETNVHGPGLQLQPGWSNTQAATYLLQNGMHGQEMTDYLRAQGYQDNGLYYPDTGMYGFGNAYMGQDSNGGWFTHQRDPEPSGGGGMGWLDTPMANMSASPHSYSANSGGGGGDIMAQLAKLFPNGGFNQDLVNKRVSNATDSLNRNRKSQLATNSAMLANRGQGANDGTTGTAAGNLETRLGQDFNSNVNDIYANEGSAADSRMMQALQTAAGLSASDAKNAVDMARINSESSLGWGNIDLNRTLGLGNLALGNTNSAHNYNLGLGQLGLGRSQLQQSGQNSSMDQLIRLLDLYMRGGQTSTDGYI